MNTRSSRTYPEVKPSDKMLESPLLIQAIEKHPSLWDPSNIDYNKNLLKDDTWNKVCQEIYSNWDQLSKTEKHEKKQDAKKRWNNIRDYYKKDLNSQKDKRYQYAQLLQFMKPVVKRKRQHESHASDSDDDDDDDNDNDNRKQTVKKQPAPSSIPNQTQKAPKQIEPKKVERNTFEHSIFSSVLDRAEDSDFLFLKSLLPDMKKMTDDQKFDFKLGIMQLYRTITRSVESTRTESMEDQKDFLIDPLSRQDD